MRKITANQVMSASPAGPVEEGEYDDVPATTVDPIMDRVRRETEERLTRERTELLPCGFTVAELRAAFERVQEPSNWKMPIDTTINHSLIAVTYYAVIHFAGGGLKIVGDPMAGRVRVTAPGYYALIGS